jgi:hypothetical protein
MHHWHTISREDLGQPRLMVEVNFSKLATLHSLYTMIFEAKLAKMIGFCPCGAVA